MKTVTEKYHAVLEEKMTKQEFLRQMRQQYPTLVTQFNGFDDTVKIFKNKGMLFEKTEVEVYDERQELNTSLDALERGIRYELEAAGVDIYKKLATKEEYEAAKEKAEKNLKKDSNYYLNILAGESPSVNKNDKPVEVKRSEQAIDTFNNMKKAELKEGLEVKTSESELNEQMDIYDQIANDEFGMDYDQLGPNEKDWVRDKVHNSEVEEDYSPSQTSNLDSQGRPGYHPDGTPKSNDEMDDDEREDFYNDSNFIDEYKDTKTKIKESLKKLKEVFPKIPSDILKEFATQHTKQLRESDTDSIVEAFVNFIEAKAKPDYLDVDGDGNKEETFKKAVKDKESSEALKEAIKKVIVKVLSEGKKKPLNEAATVNLAKLGNDYENWSGMKEAIIDLQNIVTSIESFYDSMRDKVQAVYNKLGDIRNENGLKVGPLIAPSVESAFLKDLKDVKQFNVGLTLPKARMLTSKELQAMRASGELEEEEKQTLFNSKPAV